MLSRRLTDGCRILMTADAVGGIWTYAIDLGRGLAEGGAAVTLAVLGPAPDEAQRRVAGQAGLDVVVLGHAPEWLASGPDEVSRAAAAIAALAQETRADLLHLNHPALGAAARFGLPVVTLCHSCVATWWAAVEGTALPRDLAWQADLVGHGYGNATAVVAPSRAFADATRETYGLPRTPVVVPNGRARAPIRPAPTEPVRAALTIGRLWDRGKDAETLDRAAAQMSIPVRAAGTTRGPDGSAITLRHVEALGSLPETGVRDLLAERPVFVSAARYEPFGLSVLEAAQAGCALVLADIPTFRELWGDAALFVGVGDVGNFAAEIERLAEDLPLRQRLGEDARRRADLYRLDLQVERMAELYATLLSPAETGSHAA